MKKLYTLTIFLIGIFVLSACGNLQDPDNIWNVQRPAAEGQSSRASVPLTNLSSGTFEGTGTGGYYGDVSVAVTVDASGSIAGVEVTYHNETPAFANRAFDSMIPAIISAQTYDVDTIGGATHSSTALRAAVQDALNQAQN